MSLYALDANSISAARVMQQSELPLVITPLCEVELINALQLRVFRREITAQQGSAAADLFTRDLQSGVFAVKPLTISVFERAKKIARKRTAALGTRSLDLLHVASALVVHAERIYSFDHEQQKLARLEGLKIW